ncbi:MAG TPA: hypothetical protein DEV81_03120, partial [Cyanobacteria bacterium UBA11049]|nr:hypothetical protein [Cyanobacteria bacterium UBA11049]
SHSHSTEDNLYPDQTSPENDLYPPYGSPEGDLYPEHRATKEQWEEVKEFTDKQELEPFDKRRVINYHLDID